MARGGQNKTPKEVKELKGTSRPDRGTRLTEIEKQQIIPNVEMPLQSWLDGELLEIEKVRLELQNWMNKFNMGQVEYSHAATILIDTYMQYVTVQKLIRDEGIDAKIGERSLAITVLSKLRTELRAQLYEFGLTPSAKSSMDIKDVVSNDPFSSFFGDK